MSNSSGSASAKTRGSDRFYTPPALRSNQNQLQKPTEPHSVEPDTRTDSNELALPRPANLSNLDSLLASLTPFVPVKFLSEPGTEGSGTSESNGSPYFFLEDLWDSFREWSAYGAEVQLMINEDGSIKQYYVPYLSAIQLYAEPQTLRRLDEDSGAESSKETSKVGGSNSEGDKQVRGGDLMSISSQRLSELALTKRTTSTWSHSNDVAEACNSPSQLVYEYFEGAPPHFRPPFHDKVSTLASNFPYLKIYRSCNILPSSWFSVAWYPIYRIPVGPTLKSLDAAFLTFHSLSTHSRGKNLPEFHASSGRKVHSVDGSSNISLPIFALATYKLRGSILTPTGASELHQMNSLLKAAADWLQDLQVEHPDYDYFVKSSPQWR